MRIVKPYLIVAALFLLPGCTSQHVTSHDFHYGVSPEKLNRLMGNANQEIGEQFLLMGSFYQIDRTVKDLRQARHYYRLAAEKGNSRAQNRLGQMLFEGIGGPRDYDEAFQWLGRSAEQGNRDAQVQVGLIYHRFLDAKPDYVKAYKWLTLGGDKKKVDQLEAEMTSEEIIQAQRLARAWKPKTF